MAEKSMLVVPAGEPTARQQANALVDRIHVVSHVLATLCTDLKLGDAIEVYAAAIATVLHARTREEPFRSQRPAVFAEYATAVSQALEFLAQQEATREAAPAGQA